MPEEKFIEFDNDIINKLQTYPNLAINGKVSEKILNSIKYIYDARTLPRKEIEKGALNIFKGIFIKVTRHYAAVGYRTEIGLIYQSYWSEIAEHYYVDYIILEEETHQYEGRSENYILHSRGQWALSPNRESLGEVYEMVKK